MCLVTFSLRVDDWCSSLSGLYTPVMRCYTKRDWCVHNFHSQNRVKESGVCLLMADFKAPKTGKVSMFVRLDSSTSPEMVAHLAPHCFFQLLAKVLRYICTKFQVQRAFNPLQVRKNVHRPQKNWVNRTIPCFMVRDGVDSSKKPTTFAGVPATMLHPTKLKSMKYVTPPRSACCLK